MNLLKTINFILESSEKVKRIKKIQQPVFKIAEKISQVRQDVLDGIDFLDQVGSVVKTIGEKNASKESEE